MDRPQKRVRTAASRVRSAASSRASSIVRDTRVGQSLSRSISRSELARSEQGTPELSEDQISVSQRSGRTVRLPTRFR